MNRRRKVTLKTIAEHMNLSHTTVSKALRDGSDISKETCARVKKVAKELGYRPNLMARTLKNHCSHLLGVIVPDLRISFYSEAARGIYERARSQGYVAIIMVNDENPDTERSNLEFLADWRVDGLLINPAPGKQNYDLLTRLAEEGMPIICYDRRLDELNFSSVTIDDVKAASILTSQLIEDGCRDIVYLGPRTSISVVEDRFEGYKQALQAHDIPVADENIVHCELYRESSYKAMAATLQKGHPIDAVVCVGGLVAMGAGQAIMSSKRRIPDDIALAEFGDNNIVSRLGVPFYTINQNPHLMGSKAVDLLMDTIHEEAKERHEIIDAKLLYRSINTVEVDA